MNKGTILIVEDDAISRLAMSRFLTLKGYAEPLEALTGEDAVQMVQARDVDLVIMDIRLGRGVDGIAAAEVIQRIKPVPVIFTSGICKNTFAQNSQACQISSPQVFFSKPIDYEELVEAIAEYFSCN